MCVGNLWLSGNTKVSNSTIHTTTKCSSLAGYLFVEVGFMRRALLDLDQLLEFF